jgi:hypothetical protein
MLFESPIFMQIQIASNRRGPPSVQNEVTTSGIPNSKAHQNESKGHRSLLVRTQARHRRQQNILRMREKENAVTNVSFPWLGATPERSDSETTLVGKVKLPFGKSVKEIGPTTVAWPRRPSRLFKAPDFPLATSLKTNPKSPITDFDYHEDNDLTIQGLLEELKVAKESVRTLMATARELQAQNSKLTNERDNQIAAKIAAEREVEVIQRLARRATESEQRFRSQVDELERALANTMTDAMDSVKVTTELSKIRLKAEAECERANEFQSKVVQLQAELEAAKSCLESERASARRRAVMNTRERNEWMRKVEDARSEVESLRILQGKMKRESSESRVHGRNARRMRSSADCRNSRNGYSHSRGRSRSNSSTESTRYGTREDGEAVLQCTIHDLRGALAAKETENSNLTEELEQYRALLEAAQLQLEALDLEFASSKSGGQPAMSAIEWNQTEGVPSLAFELAANSLPVHHQIFPSRIEMLDVGVQVSADENELCNVKETVVNVQTEMPSKCNSEKPGCALVGKPFSKMNFHLPENLPGRTDSMELEGATASPGPKFSLEVTEPEGFSGASVPVMLVNSQPVEVRSITKSNFASGSQSEIRDSNVTCGNTTSTVADPPLRSPETPVAPHVVETTPVNIPRLKNLSISSTATLHIAPSDFEEGKFTRDFTLAPKCDPADKQRVQRSIRSNSLPNLYLLALPRYENHESRLPSCLENNSNSDLISNFDTLLATKCELTHSCKEIRSNTGNPCAAQIQNSLKPPGVPSASIGEPQDHFSAALVAYQARMQAQTSVKQENSKLGDSILGTARLDVQSSCFNEKHTLETESAVVPKFTEQGPNFSTCKSSENVSSPLFDTQATLNEISPGSITKLAKLVSLKTSTPILGEPSEIFSDMKAQDLGETPTLIHLSRIQNKDPLDAGISKDPIPYSFPRSSSFQLKSIETQANLLVDSISPIHFHTMPGKVGKIESAKSPRTSSTSSFAVNYTKCNPLKDVQPSNSNVFSCEPSTDSACINVKHGQDGEKEFAESVTIGAKTSVAPFSKIIHQSWQEFQSVNNWAWKNENAGPRETYDQPKDSQSSNQILKNGCSHSQDPDSLQLYQIEASHRNDTDTSGNVALNMPPQHSSGSQKPICDSKPKYYGAKSSPAPWPLPPPKGTADAAPNIRLKVPRTALLSQADGPLAAVNRSIINSGFCNDHRAEYLPRLFLGTWMLKSDRHNRNAHARFFWINHTDLRADITMMWSTTNPFAKEDKAPHSLGATGRRVAAAVGVRSKDTSTTVKSLAVTAIVQSNQGRHKTVLQPGLNHRENTDLDVATYLVIFTSSGRQLRLQAPSQAEHDAWFFGVSYLLDARKRVVQSNFDSSSAHTSGAAPPLALTRTRKILNSYTLRWPTLRKTGGPIGRDPTVSPLVVPGAPPDRNQAQIQKGSTPSTPKSEIALSISSSHENFFGKSDSSISSSNSNNPVTKEPHPFRLEFELPT